MTEELIVKHCSPTLAGLKTGNMFSCPNCCEKQFPHEVGLFLGYPPEDVEGFIKNKACACKCVGCWKVYGDETKALKIFEKYKKCTEIYCKQWKEGKTLDCLCVAS